MSKLIGWFADTRDERHNNFTWQPCLQLDGYQVSMPIWFETQHECNVFIRTEILGHSMIDLGDNSV